jgi:fucose permease
VPVFLLSCLTYLSVALPGSTLGMLWPSMRMSIHEPVGALGIVLVAGVAAAVVSSAATGRVLERVRQGPLLAVGAVLVSAALAAEAAAPALWIIVVGSALFSTGFGAIDSALNAYAARHFGPRDINWMHASYGLGATLGPLLVTALLASGSGWRLTMGSMSIVLAAIAVLLAAARHRWRIPAVPAEEVPSERRRPSPGRIAILAGLTFTAVETGVESAAGIWGFVFLTSGRGLPVTAAGIAVSAYWAMIFAGRAVLGTVAQRAGASRVLAVAVACVPFGALLMALPGPGAVPVAGMMVLGLAAAPVFPLLTLTTADRVGVGGATQTVGLQVAASAVGSAAVPSVIGLVIGAVSARALGPALLVLAGAMCAVYWLALRPVPTDAGARHARARVGRAGLSGAGGRR